MVTFIRGVYNAERTWIYAGEVTCDVRIVYSAVRYGSGDEDDPPELVYDVERDTFYVEYGSTVERGVFNTGGGGFGSVDAAMRHAETTLQSVKWID